MKSTNSFATKLSRKTRKYSEMLLRDTGIQQVTESKFVMVCNAGLVSGIKREKLLEIFSNHPIHQIFMVPGKSYSFVQFATESQAREAINAIHGKVILTEIRGPLYLLPIEKIPENYSISTEIKPQGLATITDFIAEEEEKLLVDFMIGEFADSKSDLKNRSVKHYGFEFNYETNSVIKTDTSCDPIPKQLSFVIERFRDCDQNLRSWLPNQLTVNMYQPGHGIPSHVETHSAFDNIILSLSTNSDIVMEFKIPGSNPIPIHLPRRSLLIMSDECRYAWKHGITPRKFDIIENDSGLTTLKREMRISFTFRRVLETSICSCLYPALCDSRKPTNNYDDTSIDNEFASHLEQIHVHDVYEEIATHFSETRHKPWPNVEQFVKSFEVGSLFVDIGCGNGKYFGLNASIFEIGCDRSAKLVRECYEKNRDALITDCLRLPFRSDSIDYCTCIAVLHHLCTKSRRAEAIREMGRVLRPHGQALIYVWAKNQRQDKCMSSYLKQRNRNRKHVKDDEPAEGDVHSISIPNQNGSHEPEGRISLPVHVNRTDFKYDDMLVPWKMKSTNENAETSTYLRYYHVFENGELESLCDDVEEIKVVRNYYDQGNWCIIFEKRDYKSKPTTIQPLINI